MLSNKTKIAIVGRPNVGKSTLFNILTNSRRAVVKNQPGVTRDVQYGACEWAGVKVDILDTGGVTDSKDLIPALIKQKVLETIKKVDAIVFVLDGREGLHPDDKTLLSVIKKSGKPFYTLVNKMDSLSRLEEQMAEFYALGIDLHPAAFETRMGITEMLEWVVLFANKDLSEEPNPDLTIAIVGKPNVGKSSLCNQLIGESRVLVSEIAGTTVDAIDIPIERRNRKYVIIDTAGLRKKAKRSDDVEIIASFKSVDSIQRANFILLVVDATEPLSEQEAKIMQLVAEHHKPVIVVANKTDVAKKTNPEYKKKFRKQVERTFHFFDDVPIEFSSAKTGAGIDSLFSRIDDIWDKVQLKIPTAELNRFFTKVIRKAPAPVCGTKNVKFFYLTQTKQYPPSFIAFANLPQGVTTSYRRFLAKQIKEEWGLQGIPIRIHAMKTSRKSDKVEHGP